MAAAYVYEDDATGFRLIQNGDLPTSGVTAATYGDGTHVSQVTVNAQGVITSAANVAITAGSGITSITSTGGTITVGNPGGPTTNVDLATSGVVAGTYGDSTDVAVVTVNNKGVITSATTASITGSGSVAGADGWTDDTAESWTFASASTFTVGASDLTAKFSTGTRLKLTQSSAVKFFVVVGSSFGAGTTTVTITGGTDYTFANAAVSANFYSYQVNPQGWPGWFNWSPSLTGFSGSPTISTAQFNVAGKICHVLLTISGTSNSANFKASMPITARNVSSPGFHILRTTNSGTAGVGVVDIDANTTNANFGQGSGLGENNFATSGTKGCVADFFYSLQ